MRFAPLGQVLTFVFSSLSQGADGSLICETLSSKGYLLGCCLSIQVLKSSFHFGAGLAHTDPSMRGREH